jgi:hypothetical protein
LRLLESSNNSVFHKTPISQESLELTFNRWDRSIAEGKLRTADGFISCAFGPFLIVLVVLL